MRYTLTLPLADNDGESAENLIAATRKVLARKFGGFTEIAGQGYWGSPHSGHEPVVVFIIDSDADHALDTIKVLARTFKLATAQDAVYVTAQPITTYLV